MDRHQILGVVGALLPLGLFGSKLSGRRRSATIFFNKSAAEDLCRLPGSLDLETLPASRGGEGESEDFTVRLAAVLPASLGCEGEGGSGQSLLAQCTRSRLVSGCCLKGRNSISSSSLARHGGGRR
jgi:hypothetical protein